MFSYQIMLDNLGFKQGCIYYKLSPPGGKGNTILDFRGEKTWVFGSKFWSILVKIVLKNIQKSLKNKKIGCWGKNMSHKGKKPDKKG